MRIWFKAIIVLSSYYFGINQSARGQQAGNGQRVAITSDSVLCQINHCRCVLAIEKQNQFHRWHCSHPCDWRYDQ